MKTEVFTGLTPTTDFNRHWMQQEMAIASSWATGDDSFEKGAIDRSLKMANVIRAWLKSYVQDGEVGFQRFKMRWKYGRCTINLQIRLLVEQVLFELGPPWRSLVSGFSPY